MNNKTMQKRGNRGQFYLLAAIIIIGLILGFAAVTNYVRRGGFEREKVYDLSEELGFEGGRVIDYGVFNSEDLIGEDGKLREFTRLYTDYAGEGRNMYFVFGTTKAVVVTAYEEVVTGEISVNIGGGDIVQPIDERIYTQIVFKKPKTNKIKVEISGIDYTFDLKPGENFYFIISQEIGEEVFVARSDRLVQGRVVRSGN